MKSVQLSLYAALALMTSGLHAQSSSLHISPNTFVKVVGNAHIKLNNLSWKNDGSFVAGNSTVEFQGSTATGGQILGSQVTTFQNLSVNRPGLSVQLGQQAQVNGDLLFTNGTFDLNGNDLIIGQPGGLIVNETENNRITGASGGEVVLTPTLANPAQINPGNIGLTFMSMANLGPTTIRRGHVPTAIPGSGATIARYYSIQPTNNTGLDATLRFQYLQNELNGLNEADLNLYRGLGTTWQSGNNIGTGPQTKDNTQNWVQKAGIPQFTDRWTLANCAPTNSAIAKAICPGQTFNFNNQDLSVAGIYKDTLTTANGCDSIVTLTLSELPKPPADAGTDKRICTGSSVTLTATGGQAYRWDDNSTNASLQLTPLTSGFKYVTVTDANGCSAKDSVRVDLNPVPVVAPETDKTFCNGEATPEIIHQASIIGTVFDGTNNTPSIGLPASGNNVVKIASFTATNTGNIPVTATLTVTPKYTENSLTCAGKPDTFTITVNPSPKPQISGSLNFCAGKSTTLTATGGSTYKWNDNSDKPDLNISKAGTYAVTATSALGCTASATAQVTALTPPSPSFGPSNVFAVCPGQSVTLNPGTFKQYAWSTGASTGTLTVPSTPNSYTVTVTDDNNCTAVDTAGVTELPQVGISIATPDTLTCTVTQITIDGSGSSAGPFISYAWSTTNGQIISGANANKAIIGKPGSYRFIVSSSLSTLCPDTTTVTVIEQKQAATDAVLDLKDPSCKGLTDGSLQVGNITGGLAPFAFSLNGGTFVNTKTFPNLAPGSYALTIRGRNGCDFVKNFSIKEGTGPQPGISDQTVCPGVSATFDGGNFAQWQWSNNSSQKTISVTQPGTYTLTVTDTKGCTGTDELVLQNHPAVTATATATEILNCTKGEVSIGSAGSSTGAGITYTWTTANGTIQSGANNPSATVTEGGSYQLIVRNSQTSCADTATVNVTEEGEQITAIDLQTLDVKCFADSNGQIIVAAVGTGAAPYTYKLNNGAYQNGDEFDQLKPGTYTLTVRGADGCEAQASTTIKAPQKITVNIAAPTDKLSPGSSVKLPNSITGAQGTVTYAWEGPALSCTDCSEPSVSPIFLSRYTLTITDAQGCTASAFAIVDVNSDKGQDIITPDGDDLNDGLEFEEIETEPARSGNDIIIFNRWGQPVYTAKPYANEWKGQNKNGNELPEGTYYYVLYLRDGKKEVIYGSVLLVR